uniref:Sad1 n=1 Tax=Arundo donax TaxID=35708 RepID=A0A0A9F788_ARUDO
MSSNSSTVGCPDADVFVAFSIPNVRYPPNLGANTLDIKPLSLITSPIIGT